MIRSKARVTQFLSVLVVGVLACSNASAVTTFDLLAESDTDAVTGSEVFLASYDSLADLLGGTTASGSFTQIGIGSGFGIGGLAYDGSQFHLLLESDTDAVVGSEVFLASYDSLADLLGGTAASGSFTQVGIGSDFSVGGLAYDGSQFHLLLESDTDAVTGSEVFLASYDSLADLLSGTTASGSFTQVGIGSGFGIGGLAAVDDAGGNIVRAVPEPLTAALGLMGLGVLGMATRRRVA